jgi:ATP-dependent DNA helicase RecQ
MANSKVAWATIARAAQSHFGIKFFRPGQRELIEAVLEGSDAIGLLPTGAGKSLCFQLPSLVLPRVTVVVSPLISLMKDQHEHATHADVQAVLLNSTLTRAGEREATDDIRRGKADIVYVTPERLESAEYVALLQRTGVSLFVIDEAHCVSQWGHDFRPAYLALRDAIRALGRPPVLALTATATPDVLEDMARQLGMRAPRIVNTGVARDNLFFEVIRTPNDELKRARLLAYLDRTPGSGIIYAATVRAATELADGLKLAGHDVGLYHGRLPARSRREAQDLFMADELRVMVATNAFGMGIDKPNVRFVVHWNIVDSLETYYQEAGRAGRDGREARATLFFKLEDKRVQQFFLSGRYPTREQTARVYELLHQSAAEPDGHPDRRGGGPPELTTEFLVAASGLPEKRVKAIVAQLSGAGLARRVSKRVVAASRRTAWEVVNGILNAYEQRHKDDRKRLELMMHYAQSTECRNQLFREYFDEPSGEPCGHCDNCRDDPAHALAHPASPSQATSKLVAESGSPSQAAQPAAESGGALPR